MVCVHACVCVFMCVCVCVEKCGIIHVCCWFNLSVWQHSFVRGYTLCASIYFVCVCTSYVDFEIHCSHIWLLYCTYILPHVCEFLR